MVAVALILASILRVEVVAGTGFLSAQVDKHHVKQAFLSELSGLASSSRLEHLQAELEPLFVALPKNHLGNIDSSTVRYAVHRYFIHKYGWLVKGLSTEGLSWNSSSSAQVMKNRVPNYIFELFEEQLHGNGFDVTSLAMFTAVMEDLVHKEAMDVLAQVFLVLDLPLVGSVQASDLDRAIAVFFAAFSLGDFKLHSKKDLLTVEKDIWEAAPKFSESKIWMQDTRHSLDLAGSHRRNPFIPREYSFEDGIALAQKVMHSLGSYEVGECKSVKEVLTDMDPDGLGRILLSDYYSSNNVEFHESAAYLRQWGILDDTDPKMPKVVIPNMMQSSGNCVMVTDYYSVCCPDECQGLMRQLEEKIAAPAAAPAKIAELISNLQSDSVDAPRNLSALLTTRLENIADIHGGQVQLHGRLFMQWMHHAYPQECAYPHVSGTVIPVSEIEWADRAGTDDALATDAEKQSYLKKDQSDDALTLEDKINAIPWSSVEELVVTPRRHAPASSLFKQVRFLIGLAALGSMLLPLLRATKPTGLSAAHDKPLCV